jgi:hypothetical protein
MGIEGGVYTREGGGPGGGGVVPATVVDWMSFVYSKPSYWLGMSRERKQEDELPWIVVS